MNSFKEPSSLKVAFLSMTVSILFATLRSSEGMQQIRSHLYTSLKTESALRVISGCLGTSLTAAAGAPAGLPGIPRTPGGRGGPPGTGGLGGAIPGGPGGLGGPDGGAGGLGTYPGGAGGFITPG